MMYGNYGYGYGLTNLFGGGIIMIIFWVVIIGLILWIIRETSWRHRHMDSMNQMGEHHGSKALDILKERFAKGELTKEEFEEKKRIIS